jgi:hypothetical protein
VNPGLTIVHCLSCLNEIMVHFRALCCWLPGTHFTLSCASLAVCDMLLSISRSIPSSQPITRPARQQISATESIPISPPPRSLGRFLGSKQANCGCPHWGSDRRLGTARVGAALPPANMSHSIRSVTALFLPKKQMPSETDPGRYTNRAIGTRMSST